MPLSGTQLDSIQRQLGGHPPRAGDGLNARSGPEHLVGEVGASSPRGAGLLGTFTNLSKAMLVQQDVKLRSFVEELLAAEPERRHREKALQQVRPYQASNLTVGVTGDAKAGPACYSQRHRNDLFCVMFCCYADF